MSAARECETAVGTVLMLRDKATEGLTRLSQVGVETTVRSMSSGVRGTWV